MLEGGLDVGVPGQGLEHFRGDAGHFEVGNELTADRVEVEEPPVVAVGQAVGQKPANALVRIFGGFLNPCAAGGGEVRLD
ncbi:hypothetical protein AYO44_11365 [Planctomycetaceae bacterium SCGC AG-212-F19]|nr:hypothetical protein AYO44_11365 [Planctomycetaceae bacterium SCGC AG-212-F19]